MIRYLPTSKGKRFTETSKWEQAWFRKLSPAAKNLWQWLNDYCDNAGVIEPDLPLAAFQIGEPINEKHLAEFGQRIKTLPDGKIWLCDFIPRQYGVKSLSPRCPAHKSLVKLIQSHGLEYPIPSITHRQPMAMGKHTHGVPLAKGTGYGYGNGHVRKERGMGKTNSFQALALTNIILSNRDGWHYDNCKVDINRISQAGLRTVIEPFVDRVKNERILREWQRAVTTAHSAKVDGLAKDPTAYAVQCFKNQLTEAYQPNEKK